MAVTEERVARLYRDGLLTNKAAIGTVVRALNADTTRTYMVTVESEGLSADWLDDVIVIAKDEADAKLGAEATVREYRPRATIKEGTEVYELAVEHPRVVGILVPRDER